MGSRLSNGEVMRGIFIKHVLEDSPAGKNGTLKPGDRIVEVTSRELSIQDLFPRSLSYLRSCCPSPCVSQTFVMARVFFFLSRFFFFFFGCDDKLCMSCKNECLEIQTMNFKSIGPKEYKFKKNLRGKIKIFNIVYVQGKYASRS